MNAETRNDPARPRILFVDDSRLMRACAERILGEQFDLLLAESAEEAWELLQTDNGIMALFSDLRMAGRSGFDLLEQVRCSEREELADLPVVLITGEEDSEQRRHRALALGATDFIAKPFQASELTARAAAYARTGRSSRRLRLLESEHHIDPATGLGNRRYCEERLLQAMSFAHRHKQPLVLMHLRLEGFSALLEELGETHAERALSRIGSTLAERVRREDTVFRTGEETFSFLLPATDAEGARSLQHRFLPDLDALGLCPDNQALPVNTGFIIQTPPAPNGREAAQIIDEGLSGRVVPIEMARRGRPGPPDLEQAMRMLERGEFEQLRPFVPMLKDRLGPLMELLDSGGPGAASRRGGSD